MAHQWIARWLRVSLILIGLFVAFGAFAYSNAMNLRRAAPQTAYSLYPDNPGVIAARYNDFALNGKQLTLTVSDQRELQKALVGDPLNRTLVRSLAIWHDVNREPVQALAGMQLSSAVSRRDTLTQLWLVEYWLRESNASKAYQHIDLALRIRPELSALLFPRLYTLMGDSNVADKVELAARSEVKWVPGFADFLVANDPSAAYALLTRLTVVASSDAYASANRTLAHNLARAGSVSRAATIVKLMVPQDHYAQWASVGLNRWSTDARLGNLSWAANPNYASLAPFDSKQFELQALVPSDQTVELMSRGIFLLPGTSYKLEGSLSPGGDLGDAKFQWILSCWTASGENWYHVQDLSRNPQNKFSIKFTVPRGCPYTKVTLRAIGPTSAIPVDFGLSSLSIARLAES